jgi:hypothetical protein
MSSSNSQPPIPGFPDIPANIMNLPKDQRQQILKNAFEKAIEVDIPLHRSEEFHQYHDTEQNSGWARSPNMMRLASRLLEKHEDLHVDIADIQDHIDTLNERFREEIESTRGICSQCGSFGVCARPLSDDGHWIDE